MPAIEARPEREGKGREGKGREGKGREGKGREGKGREGKGREGKAMPCHSIATVSAVAIVYIVHAGSAGGCLGKPPRDAAWQHRQKFEESTARPKQRGCVRRPRAGA
jgi:hypothetical protein